jgi:hypothetical protein
MVDDAGRGDARPAIIKGRVFPLRERVTAKDIDASLHGLADKGCVSLYVVGGKPYFYFPTWADHQRVRDVKPKYPGPEDSDNLPQIAADCGGLPQIAADCVLNPIQSESNSNPNPNPNPRRTRAQSAPKVQWAENVTMTNDEHEKLLAAHGPADAARLIEILDNYKGSSGKKYQSDYRAILSWCVDRLEKEKRELGHSGRVNPTEPPKNPYLEMLEGMTDEQG